MSNPSNLYAEKIYSEHPLGLWALDDKLDYIGLISEPQRQIYDSWTITDAVATLESESLEEPFSNSALTLVEVDVPAGDSLEASLVSDSILNFNDLELSLDSFCVGTYFYSNSLFLQSISIGYEYTDPTTSSIVQQLKTFSTSLYQKWGLISETFEIPNVNADLRIVIKINMLGGSTSSSENQIYFNGITLGQWNEAFNSNSYGVTPITIPSNISVYGGLEGIEAKSYGVADNSGYYIINDGLKCKNLGIPLVYGASGVTRIEPNEDASLIIPGKGFLNKNGQYNDYTVEFWARVNCDTPTAKKIFGPINSKDGLYVEGGFLTLVINDRFASHFVSEWFRPMLIQIRLIKNSASLIINGEEVFSLSITTSDLVLPDEKDEFGDNQDWLGFYGYSDVYPFEIDCVAIYSYQVPAIVAKRRWVYGQGVISLENINSAYKGTSAFIDYPFSNYTANYNYPDFARWDQGTFDNLSVTENTLRTPKYTLPEIFLETKTLQQLYDDNKDIQDNESGPVSSNKFLSFRPNNTWNSINSYINFPKFNLLSEQIESFYGVFSSSNLDSEEVLFKLYNPITKDYFSIIKNENVIEYSLNYNGVNSLLFTSDPINANSYFAVGCNLTDLVNNFGNDAPAFFGNQNSLKMYACGDDSGNYTFTGRLYSIGFSSIKNYSKISEYFNSEGIIELDSGDNLVDYIASYTLFPSESYEEYFLDIGVAGYWQDYLPLSYFGQFVQNSQGERFYDLDFLQFNIGYPEIVETFIKTTDGGVYDEEGNSVDAGFYNTVNFDALFDGDFVQNGDNIQYNTENCQIKSYITFQYISDGANIPTEFSVQEPPNKNKIVDLSEYEDWENIRFEILNNTLIYPTKEIDFNTLAIVYSLEFSSRGILTKPLILNRLQLASQAFNDNSNNLIGTRLGVDLIPYKKNGIYYSYKSKNPFSIYKESTPYLYLTNNSGIEVRGDFNILENRGLSFPINKELSTSYKVSAINLWTMYNQDLFPRMATEIFEINHKDGQIKFYIQANSLDANRGKVFALDGNGNQYNGISFYLNGQAVREPVLSIKEWSSIGVSFLSALSFNSYLGNINITGPGIFNNIAYYEASSLQSLESITTRPWIKVLTDGTTTFDWQYWFNNFNWNGVLVVSSEEFYLVDPSDIYKTQIGTNKILIDDGEGIIYQPEKLKVYEGIDWSVNVSTPV